MLLVSVPYRGATFLNGIAVIALFIAIVSVPYRGATFLNGDYMNLKGFDVPGFRPLSGSYISQYNHLI